MNTGFVDINEKLAERLSAKEFLIAVHRGSSTGNIIQNTYLSSKLAIKLGGDLFEIDLSNSTDGKLYMFHDGGEKHLFNIEENIKTLSSEEIEKLEYHNWLGEPSNRHVETFESLLSRMDDNWLFNIDRAWWFLPDVDEIMQRFPQRIKQAIIKTRVCDEYLDFFSSCPRKYMYMPIVTSIEDQKKVLERDDINTVGMELIFPSPDDEIIQDENVRLIREKGLFVWVNTITLGAKKVHCLAGGLDDDKAIENDPDSSWGTLLKKGVNVLQTDWPSLMWEYRETRI